MWTPQSGVPLTGPDATGMMCTNVLESIHYTVVRAGGTPPGEQAKNYLGQIRSQNHDPPNLWTLLRLRPCTSNHLCKMRRNPGRETSTLCRSVLATVTLTPDSESKTVNPES